jgi:hypothetical protein
LETVYWLRFGLGILAALLCVGFLIIAGAIHTNVVPNSSVEIGNPAGTAPQDWISSGNGTEWNAVNARTGSRSLRIEVSNGNAEWNVTIGPIVGGNTYHIDGYFFGQVTGGQFLLNVSWFSDSGGEGVLLSQGNFSLTGNYSQWQVQGGDFTAPVGAKSCEIGFKAIQGSGDIYGDDFEVRQTEPNTSFFNSASIAVLVYISSYYVLKSKFATKVAKPQKILTAGIGIYLLTWIVFWALLYTIATGF